jgi:ABC-type branched-subunit amino acid transport system ATPase component
LRDVSLSIPARAATLVCGPVASGKTLFLLGLLGEADVDAGGKVDFPRSQDADIVSGKPIEASQWLQEGTAYVHQLPWLRNATIKSARNPLTLMRLVLSC